MAGTPNPGPTTGVSPLQVMRRSAGIQQAGRSDDARASFPFSQSVENNIRRYFANEYTGNDLSTDLFVGIAGLGEQV